MPTEKNNIMQLTRDRIITELYNSPDIAAAIGRMQPERLQDDLRQEMFVALCALDEADLLGMYQRKEVKYWLARVMLNMATSSRSSFYNQYRKFAEALTHNNYYITTEGTVNRQADVAEAYTADYTESAEAFKPVAPSALVHHDEIPDQWTDFVSNAVDELDFYEREIFRLYTEHGNNCRLVAEQTGISERNVRYAVAMARQKLQNTLRSND